MIPNAQSYCDIDPRNVDQWGIPVLRFHWRWSEHEIKQARHMHQTFVSIIEAMGGKSAGLRIRNAKATASPSAARSFTKPER